MNGGLRLRDILLVVLPVAFVTLLVVFTDDLSTYWPLYGIPVVAAALTFNVPGAVLTAAYATALAAILHYESEGGGFALPRELIVGMAVFAGIGIIAGSFARSSEERRMRLEACAAIDPLTGLHSENCFHERLTEEVARADRYGVSVAVALVEIDDLHAFREKFGHHRGDLLLAHVAELLRISIRSTDVLACHAEGFGIVLPFSDMAAAHVVSDRVRTVVREAEFEGDELEPVTKHTLTVSVCAYPTPARDMSALLAFSEEGLAQAREEGGDRTVVGHTPAALSPHPDIAEAPGRA